ncbi:YALIA101S05e04984g1_1 [Yarrowia lipolytica]|nr:Hypothetical protein YALI2_E01670g [Yarrowia lipolytica]SEI34549.1 YALIA101S05e04984g1_1 [Yarrowia lipolytica]VBB79121.1 Hypothetical protein conserved in the Yarrowia clade [Yarrowia lipolytica]
MALRHDDTRHVSKLSLSQTLSRWKNRSRESLNFDEPAINDTATSTERERNLGRRKSSISSFTSFMSSNSSNSERSLKTMGRAKTVNEEVTRPKSRSKDQPQKTADNTRRIFSGNASYSSLIDISEEKKPKETKNTKNTKNTKSPSPLSTTPTGPATTQTMISSTNTNNNTNTKTNTNTNANTNINTSTTTNKAEIIAANPPTTPSPLSKPPPSKRFSLAVVSSSPSFSSARTTRPASMSLSPILPERSAKRASVLQVAPFFQRPTAIKEPEEEESSASSGSDDLFSDTEDPYVDPTINLDEYDEDDAEIFCKAPLKHKVVCITCGHKFDTIDECFSHREKHQQQAIRRPLTQGTTKMKRPASIAVDVQKERAALVQTKSKRFTSSRHSWSVREMGRV